MEKLNYDNDICIVAYAGIFPDAENSEKYFKNLLEKKISIKDLTNISFDEFYHDMAAFYDKDSKKRNKSSSPFGAILDRRMINDFCKELQIPPEQHTSTEIVALKLADEIFKKIDSKILNEKLDIIVGHTSVDNEQVFKELDRAITENNISDFKFKNPKKNVPLKRYKITTSFVELIRRTKKINEGVTILTDAACASSLSAIYCSVKRLRLGKTSFVLTGGIDVNQCPFLDVMFSKAKVLSNNVTSPFDESTKGMNQGEAGALFLLTTREIAEKNHLTPIAYIVECEGASDGGRGGVIEPTEEGQMLAYKRVYKNEEKLINLNYIEAHGTGTIVGDKTELQSLAKFFKDKKIPIGSAKSNIGHTIATAGSASLIKVLEILKNKKIPPSPSFKKFPGNLVTNLFVNSQEIKLEEGEFHAGISSFGFGGTNFHLHFSNVPSLRNKELVKNEIYLIAQKKFYLSEIDLMLRETELKIPPVTLDSFDKIVLLGILSVERLIKENEIYFHTKLREVTHVISSGSLVLDLPNKLAEVLMLEYLLVKTNQQKSKEIIEGKLKNLPAINENTGASVLNNLIAGRVSKTFDFKGVNFHVDSDTLSSVAAMEVMSDILESEDGACYVIDVLEEFDEKLEKFVRSGLQVSVYTTKNVIKAHSFRPLLKFESICWKK